MLAEQIIYRKMAEEQHKGTVLLCRSPHLKPACYAASQGEELHKRTVPLCPSASTPLCVPPFYAYLVHPEQSRYGIQHCYCGGVRRYS